jgi:hypothetical protein
MNLQCLRCGNAFSRKSSDINRGRTKFCGRECSDAYKKERAEKHAIEVLKNNRKQCKACNITKPLIEFPPSKASRTGYFSYCIECRKEMNRKQDAKRWSEKREILIAQRRRAHLRREFGITIEHFEELFQKQGGVCMICKQNSQEKQLAVDHDHKTGKIRSLLCENCNRGLGMFSEDISRLKNAIEYLNAYQSQPSLEEQSVKLLA